MATAGVNRMMLWTDLEGRELLGRWRLDSLVRPEGRTAWFTATSEGRALMLSITETLNDDEELLARLNAVARVRHPNVVAVEEACAAYVDDTPVVIAAMEPTDETLGDVLRERSLQPMEAQQVLRALVQGLSALHAAGLVHGRMEPASVLAMGETVKLRSDCVQRGGDDFAARSADDVRGLGRIITRSVTGRMPAGENDPMLQLLPEPMARAVRRALSGNARIAEIAALAGVVVVPAERVPEKPPMRMGPVAVPSPAPATSGAAAPAIPLPGSEPSAAAVHPAGPLETVNVSDAPPPKPAAKVIALLAATSQAETPKQPERREPVRPLEPLKPAMAAEPEIAHLQDDEPEMGTQRRSAPWVVALAALLVVATLWALYGMVHAGRKTAKPVPPAAVATPAPSAQKPAAAQQPRAQASGGATVALNTPGWRVIAYTYRQQAQAQHKADDLRQRYPQWSPGVFALHGRAPYLVTLGGVMSKADAFALREKAVRMGLPRDTYTQNYR